MNLSPRSRMSATITFNKPFGIPDSSNTRATSVPPVIAVSSCGFSTTPFPAPIAVATERMLRKNGKLNGLITPTTPTGTRYNRFSLPSTDDGIISPTIRSG